MPSDAGASVADRFTSERGEPLRLGETPPRVHGFAWRHPSPLASIVLVHGLQSHSGWFGEAAELLVERGMAVYAVDRRGSGSSPERRGHVEDYGVWFDEVAQVGRLAAAEHPEAPVHVIGHCFGANVAIGCALRKAPDVRSVVMLTPGLYVLPDYTTVEKARIATAALLRRDVVFRVPQDDELFTRDPEVLAWIEADMLGAKTLTARCLLEIGRMLRRLRTDVGRLGVPTLVLEAAHDRIADNARNRAVLERALRDRCRFVTFDAEHFLLAEPCRDEVLDTIVRWVSGQEVER